MNSGILFIAIILSTSGISYDINVDEVPEVVVVEPVFIPEPEPIRADEPKTTYPDDWTCFEFAINYSELHPEWGMVVISDNPRFQGMNHLVNYKINDDNSLQIISYAKLDDGVSYKVVEYSAMGWEHDTCTFDYFHFYIDGEIPTRHYNRVNQYQIKPNAEEMYNNL